MNNIGNVLLGAHALFVAIITLIFFMMLLNTEDELEQNYLYESLKISIVITSLFLIGYGYYMLLVGNTNISINIIFFSIEGLSLLTLLLYYLCSKGIVFSLQIKSKKLKNVLLVISIAISALTIISQILKFKFFENNVGIARYDQVILYVNLILLGIITPQVTNIREKYSREEYKKRKRNTNKYMKIFICISIIFCVLLISYAIYLKRMV